MKVLKVMCNQVFMELFSNQNPILKNLLSLKTLDTVRLFKAYGDK